MKNWLAASLFLIAVTFTAVDASAQCAMCKASAETSLEGGSTAAAGINKGVLYLFLTPYIIAGTIGFFWWKAKKKADA
ncbi:MAG: hypothetical protein KF872_01195 [Chitinophagales bacterium]|nr:hypothetical protein [Chitinophagales bacterium]